MGASAEVYFCGFAWGKIVQLMAEGRRQAMKPDPNPVFATTHWSAVVQATRPDSPEARAALAELCRVYWYPLYAYARRQGFDVHTAQDLTQEFFCKLLEKNYLNVVDRRRGRFRSFLLTAFKCFLANEWDRSQAQKRGGGQQIFSLDGLMAEERFHLEPRTSASADQLYDQSWAVDLIDRTRTRLRDEYEKANKVERFDVLQQFLPGAEITASQAEVGVQFGLSEGAVKQEVFRLRRRFGDLLREGVAQTVVHPDEVDDELRHLIDVVCRR